MSNINFKEKHKKYQAFSNHDIFLFADVVKYEKDKEKKQKYKIIFWGFIFILLLFIVTIVTLIVRINP